MGRWWAGAGRVEDQTDDDAKRLGLDQSEQPAKQDSACEVWPEHWQALNVFLACRTQWRVIAGMGGVQYQGLDYTALESIMRMKGVDDTSAVLEQVQHMETGALEGLNAR
nr:DUF1799 domain-containing protein [Halomonas muralis]